MTTYRNSARSHRQPPRGGHHMVWCAVVVCMAWCGAQETFQACLMGQDYTTFSATVVANADKLELVGGDSYRLYCVETVTTGCAAGEAADVYVDTHAKDTNALIKSTRVSGVLIGSIVDFFVSVPTGAYYVHRHRRRSDGTICASNGMVSIGSLGGSVAQGMMKIIAMNPPTMVSGETVAATVQAPSAQDIEVFNTITCPPGDTGTVVKSITRGTTATFDVTFPSDLDAMQSYTICARVQGTAQTVNAVNMLASLNLNFISYTFAASQAGSSNSDVVLMFYSSTTLDGSTLHSGDPTTLCSALPSTPATIGTITENQVNGKTVATATVTSTVAMRGLPVCVKKGTTYERSVNVTLLRAGIASYIECGYSNACWVAAHSGASTSGLSNGAIAGIAVAGAVVLIAIVVVVIYCCMRKRTSSTTSAHDQRASTLPQQTEVKGAQ